MQTHYSPTPDSQALIGLTREQLDSVPWAVVKINTYGILTYGNQAMCEIAGVDSLEGRAIREFFRGTDLDTVREHFESRFTSRVANEYEVELIRQSDGVLVPIRCSAMPDINDCGEVVGVIAMVRNLLADDVSAKVHKSMEEMRDGREILQVLAQQCDRVVSFDMFSVTRYSSNGEHAQTIYAYPENYYGRTVRWYQMTEDAKRLVNRNKVVNVPDLEQWFNQPEWQQYRDEPDTQHYLEMGFRSSVWFPVMSGNRVVAMVIFSRKRDKGPFDDQEVERLRRLPLDGPVHMALHYREVDELKFSLDLIMKIASGPARTEFIAATLTEEIGKHYQWENVSIFRPDEQEGQLCLVKQNAEKQSFRLPANWCQAIHDGVMGHVCRTRAPLNVADVRAPQYRNLFCAGYPESCSELCMPITVDGRVYWVLNIEDSKRNAFAEEEQESLQQILRQVEVVIELVMKTQVFSELLKHSKDSVIETDFRGTIVRANPATEKLLGYTAKEMKGGALGTYFKDKDHARRVQEATVYPRNDEVRLVRKDGSEVPVLLSGTSLPRDMGLKVYICNDISERKRLDKVEVLRHMYNEIASQIKTPLSIAFTWLARLREEGMTPRAADLLDRTVKQLHRVDLTFDRLLFYERQRSIAPAVQSVFEISILFEKIRQDMPDSEAERITVNTGSGVSPVRGDLFQIWFCLESLLAYLVRFVPDSEKVAVDIAGRESDVVVTIRGYAPPVTSGLTTDYAKARWAIRAITEMALGERIIRSFIEQNHAGKFRKRSNNDETEYVVVLPCLSS